MRLSVGRCARHRWILIVIAAIPFSNGCITVSEDLPLPEVRHEFEPNGSNQALSNNMPHSSRIDEVATCQPEASACLDVQQPCDDFSHSQCGCFQNCFDGTCEDGIELPHTCHKCDSATDNGELPLFAMVADDVRSLFTAENAGFLILAGGTAAIFRSGLDDEVRENTARHPQRWGDFGEDLGILGHPVVQVPALIALAAYSRCSEDAELHSLSESLASSYIINFVATTGLKLAFNTSRPDEDEFNGEYGFPSFHTASTFAFAAVLDEYYGTRVGLPAYALASAIGWTRIDQRDHDLSDILFGAALGYVIGKSVAIHHLDRECRWRMMPQIDLVSGSVGAVWESRF